MGTVIRAEISQKNKYWISKHRYYELKHFCMQYPEWKREYAIFCDDSIPLSTINTSPTELLPGNYSDKRYLMKMTYSNRIKLIERIAREADQYLYEYIIKGVVEGRSYTYLRTVMGIPCGKDMYYDRYRKFFWLLSEERK